MDIYGKPTLVEEFLYEGQFHVQIFQARKGASHCDILHEPAETVCVHCGTGIKAEVVFFMTINKQPVEGVDSPSLEGMRDIALDYVRNLEDDGGGEIADMNRVTPMLPPPPHPSMSDDEEEDDIDWDEYEDGEPPDPRAPPRSPALKAMRQLGWPGKITALFDKYKVK